MELDDEMRWMDQHLRKIKPVTYKTKLNHSNYVSHLHQTWQWLQLAIIPPNVTISHSVKIYSNAFAKWNYKYFVNVAVL